MNKGERLGNYQILEPLGSGGMGEVYRAKDLRLGREVAVKVLSPKIRDDHESLSRFEREARALAALSHRNIAVLHNLEESDGEWFIVMELVEGEGLNRRLARGPLPLEQALEVAAQIAAALDAAHRKGIVHRDLKPANVMLDPHSEVKLLDFGLSKLLNLGLPPEDSTAEWEPHSLTRSGVVLGTAPYMSPEQVSGKQVDGRTDIWSFGCLLYEMLTGKRPFGGDSFPSMAAAILTNEPDWSLLPPELPERVKTLLRRCLEKDVEARLGAISEASRILRPQRSIDSVQVRPRATLRAGLIAGSAIAVLLLIVLWKNFDRTTEAVEHSEIRSIAVLPLVSDSADSGQEYFVDGMTDALINDLARLGLWKVISRTSVMHYKGRSGSLREIARELGVDAVVEGSVLQAGDQVRITARLIHAETEESLWVGTYDRDLKNVLALQREVAQAIATGLKGRLDPQFHSRLGADREVDPEAHRLYLKGRFLWNERTAVSLQEAIRHFRLALERDPTFAPAYGALAETYQLLAGQGIGAWAPSTAFPLTKAAARRAIELDDSLAGAHAALGYTALLWEWDWASSEREFRRALELNPSYANAHFWYAAGLASRGRLEEAIDHAEKGAELDPVSPIIAAGLAWMHYLAGDYDASISVLLPALELHPEFAILHYRLAYAYHHKGLFDEAIHHHRRAVELSGSSADMLAQFAHTLASAGKIQEASSILAQLEERKRTQYVSAYNLALIHVGLGDREAALEWLDQAVLERSWYLPFLAVEPNFRPLHGDPRFHEILNTLRLNADAAASLHGARHAQTLSPQDRVSPDTHQAIP
ncbi:MAG TPA: protein kinase [Thermoanaerobaculia bacterium]|nr:protein kinase [Thermoanaerobaculia bacterium]